MGTRESLEASRLLQEAIEELENSRGYVAPAIRKIRRAASLVNDSRLVNWCRVQLGDRELTNPIKKLLDTALETSDDGTKTLQVSQDMLEELEKVGIRLGKDITASEIEVKLDRYGGGWEGIEYIEEVRDSFARLKQASDSRHYSGNLSTTIAFVRSEAHARATELYHELEFADSARTAFDILKDAIDDKLISLSPELGEKLMLSFENVSARSEQERWSQGLTSCRRLLKELADKVFPPCAEPLNGRRLGEEQYLNRLWAFMDKAIISSSNRELAKAHIDLVGHYLESTLNVTHKGVHAEVSHLEAVRVVMHTYLVVGDILSFLDYSTIRGGEPLPNIHSASRDEIMPRISVKENIANAIIKLRVKQGQVTLRDLAKIKGIGPKTLERIQKNLSLDYPPPRS